MSRLSVLGLVVASASMACGGAAPATPAAEPSAPPGETGVADGANQGGAAGASLTAAECQAAGGEVVGDIGDGAIHRPDYRCARSGEAPLGPVTAEPGQPMAVEGSVCCR